MKKIIVALVIALPFCSLGQHTKAFKQKAEVGLAFDPIQGGGGFILKVKTKIFNRYHVESYLGVSGQYHRNKEKKFSTSQGGGTTDLGFYVVNEWLYFPLSSKNLFIGAEGFAGMTSFRTKGKLFLPDYSVNESYSHTYTYFNYGAGLNIGYNFGFLTTSIFATASLKGLLDKGRFRPMDTDSKGFFGVAFGMKF